MMRLKAQKLDVPENDPFKNDVLERKESAAVLTQLLSIITEPTVLSIDAQWGAGKTTFIEMWSQYLKNQDFTVLSFNAWKNDFCKEPLVALVAEIAEGFRNLNFEVSGLESGCDELDAVLRVGAGIAKRLAYSATAGVIDLDSVVADAKNENNKPLKNEFDYYSDTKKSIADFRIKLRKLLAAIKTRNKKDYQKPLVFMIDELDRCRPIFAIELLEIAKHLFDVPGVVFVLAIDKEQLGHSIRSVYGLRMNVDGYLRRFIDIDYRLPQCDNSLFVKAQFKQFGFVKYFEGRTGPEAKYDEEHLTEVLGQLFSIFKLSLRVQEQCLTQLSILLRTSPATQILYPEFIALLIVLRSVKRDIYDNYVAGGSAIDDIVELLSSNIEGNKFIQGDDWPVLMGYLISFCPNDSLRKSKIEDYKVVYNNIDTNTTIEREHAETILNIIGSRKVRNASSFLNTIVGKIEITQQFVTVTDDN